MAVGTAKGEDAARIAAEQAISSQLLDITIDGARGILFNVTGGSDLSLFDVNQAAAIIKETAHPEVNLIFGAVIDPTMKDAVRITVIATGFESTSMPARRVQEPNIRETRERDRQQPNPTSAARTSESLYEPANVGREPVRDTSKGFTPRVVDTKNLDVPTFLRNRVSKE
jgi:cell division protein FtsZ